MKGRVPKSKRLSSQKAQARKALQGILGLLPLVGKTDKFRVSLRKGLKMCRSALSDSNA